MTSGNGRQRVTKRFGVFDCDAHINDPDEIWTRYVAPEDRELVRRTYWKDGDHAYLNGRTTVIGGAAYDFPGYNPICLAGPQMSKKIARKLQQIGLTAEQKKYVEHPGAYDPKARLREMDLMGIDQVMIIPTMMVANFPFVESLDGAYAFARAYNDWARDYCAAAPDRLFPASSGTARERSPRMATSSRSGCRCRASTTPAARSSASPRWDSGWRSSGRSTRAGSIRTTSFPASPAARRRARWTASSGSSRRRGSCSACTPSRR